ncbi:flagellar biosynthesis protein FlhB [Photobacterium leiognathi]|uniref:flagellar biosynthesis protein FlhB n=1 Tax=Photobacterium leiognathi TaxID=553611 RepID=UPI001EE0948C|nr:flagellar biosynthesis protein FlhB [Photobacterium leiognathi]MCG3883693.1 flagellar biosynthesis protein FlhB [Photobacterium leiognathi]
MSQSGDKTEQPTPKKLKDAREKGNVPRSRELSTAFMLIIGVSFMMIFGSDLIDELAFSMRNLLAFDYKELSSPQDMGVLILQAMSAAMMTVLPFICICASVAYLAQSILGGQIFNTSKLMPKLSNISPISGVKRIFSAKTLVELLKSIMKLILVTGLCLLFLQSNTDKLISLYDSGSVSLSLELMADIILNASLSYALVLLIVTAVDVPYQLYSHKKQLMMTKQEIKDEYKNSEGSPEVKGRLRQLMREASQRRSVSAVPEADVIITNPTHYSVALRYKDGVDSAPVILSMGRNNVAMLIRTKASECRIPVLEVPPLARALYFNGKEGSVIPYELFVPVAKVLAYINGLDNKMAHHIDSVFVDDLAVPPELSER